MEEFCIIISLLNLSCNFFLYKELRRVSCSHESCENLTTEANEIARRLCHDVGRLHDKMSDCGACLSTISDDIKKADPPKRPIKLNNWDSVREAFKLPQRVEVNE
jgi:hypothetical protein